MDAPSSNAPAGRPPAPVAAWPRRFTRLLLILLMATTALPLVGCSDDQSTARKIQAGRQARRQAETQVDHLGEAFSLVSRLIELEPESAGRQIVYHLNAWQQTSTVPAAAAAEEMPTELLQSLAEVLPPQAARDLVGRPAFAVSDVEHLKYQYLLRQVTEWVRTAGPTDDLWAPWLRSRRDALGAEVADQLAEAIQLFDWTVRNIALEPMELPPLPVAAPRLPAGLQLAGAGYRQTPLQTLLRSSGDALQRSGTFLGLCRQARIPACLLATSPGVQGSRVQGSSDADAVRPWVVGVLLGGEVYLFDCGLGMPVVGPNQTGIATLTEARRDAAVLRRMNVPGWFDYPVSRDDVQQCLALLMVDPEAISQRAKRLQDSLTGDLRVVIYEDAAELASQFTSITGIAAAELWKVPLQARQYQRAIAEASTQDPMLGFYVHAPWTILEGDFDQAKRLALGRWRHLQGQFDSDQDEDIQGAKQLYLSQRQPEFEIAQLRTDVQLQMQYGIRRELGVAPEVYDRQIEQVQAIMRQGKITATYWLSLIQYDTQRMDLARNWFEDRILEDGLDSRWETAARYNLARTLERLNQPQRAAELYRSGGDPQEHGNRLRARLIQRGQDEETPQVDDAPQVDAPRQPEPTNN